MAVHQQHSQDCLTLGPSSTQTQLGVVGPHWPQDAATPPAALCCCSGACDLLLTASELFPEESVGQAHCAGTESVLQLVSQSNACDPSINVLHDCLHTTTQGLCPSCTRIANCHKIECAWFSLSHSCCTPLSSITRTGCEFLEHRGVVTGYHRAVDTLESRRGLRGAPAIR